MNLLFVSIGALFSIINPLGTLPLFVGLTQGKRKKEIFSIALRTSINTALILMISFLFGEHVLHFFGISLASLRIAGGIIIASSGFALLTGNFSSHKGMKRKVKDDAYARSKISLTPLAMPMLAGPGSISLLITYYHEYPSVAEKFIILLSILSVCLLTYILLRVSKFIITKLGASGVNALSRLDGFIVIAIGVEYILSTIITFIPN